MATGFWGGMAEGVERGMRMRTLHDLNKERKKKAEEEEAIKKAGQAGGLQQVAESDLAARASAGTVRQPGSVPDEAMQEIYRGPQSLTGGASAGDLAQAFPVTRGASQQGVGLGLAADMDVAAAKKKDAGGSDFADASNRLTASFRKAVELGRYDVATNLMGLREKVNNQYRDDALSRAMSAFELGDTSGVIAFANNFSYTPIEFTGVERAAQTQGGEPVYIVRGFNHETGEQMAQPFTQTAMTRYLMGLGDPKTYKEMYVLESKRLADMQDFKEKETFKTDEGIRGAKARHSAGIGGSGAGRPPAEIQTAQWLLNNGVAKDETEAWEMVRGARTRPRQDFALDMAKSILADQRSGMVMEENRVTPEQAFEQGLRLYDAMNSRPDIRQEPPGTDIPDDIRALMEKYGPQASPSAAAQDNGRQRYIAPPEDDAQPAGPGFVDKYVKPLSPALQMLDKYWD